MACFIATDRALLKPMWRQLTPPYWVDPDLAYMVSDALGTYMHVRWGLTKTGRLDDLPTYLADLLEHGGLQHVDLGALAACWDRVYDALVPSLRHIELSRNASVWSITAHIEHEKELVGLSIGIKPGS